MAEVIFAGSEGRLEGRYHKSDKPNAPIAVVLHPHPLYGGTMNNKVVYSVYQSFVKQGFSVLRFNFRGVGRSQGKFDDGLGELMDAATALDWIQTQSPDASTCWIAGFSFGSWIALQLLMRRPEIEGFVVAAPPANMYDFSFLSPCPASGIIVQGDKDDVVEEEAVSKLAGKLATQKGAKIEYHTVAGADHYFRSQIDEMSGLIENYLETRMDNFTVKRKVRPDRKRRQLPRA
jgi:alpha/beta superfamily hydrolase